MINAQLRFPLQQMFYKSYYRSPNEYLNRVLFSVSSSKPNRWGSVGQGMIVSIDREGREPNLSLFGDWVMKYDRSKLLVTEIRVPSKEQALEYSLRLRNFRDQADPHLLRRIGSRNGTRTEGVGVNPMASRPFPPDRVYKILAYLLKAFFYKVTRRGPVITIQFSEDPSDCKSLGQGSTWKVPEEKGIHYDPIRELVEVERWTSYGISISAKLTDVVPEFISIEKDIPPPKYSPFNVPGNQDADRIRADLKKFADSVNMDSPVRLFGDRNAYADWNIPAGTVRGVGPTWPGTSVSIDPNGGVQGAGDFFNDLMLYSNATVNVQT